MSEGTPNSINLRERLFFYIVFAILIILMLLMIQPFFTVLVVSLVALVVIAVGLFADGTYTAWPVTGLFYGGGTEQLVAQAIGAVTVLAFSFITGYVLFKGMDLIMGIRVSPEEELSGLDVFEHGASAYPNFLTVEE